MSTVATNDARTTQSLYNNTAATEIVVAALASSASEAVPEWISYNRSVLNNNTQCYNTTDDDDDNDDDDDDDDDAAAAAADTTWPFNDGQQ